MSITRKNSFSPRHSLGFTIAPFQPIQTQSARAAADGDFITLAYRHGKPSSSGDVMTAISGTFELPEEKEGEKHTVTAAGNVDDSSSLTVDDITKSSKSGAGVAFGLSIGELSKGIHSFSVVHSNIPKYPDPTGVWFLSLEEYAIMT